MKFNIKKIKTIVIASLLLFAGGFFSASFQDNISKANSILSSIIVNLPHLDFGLVFPGEQLQKTFVVSYSGSGSGDYIIIEKYKPLPDVTTPEGYQKSISDYCQEFNNDYDRCYKTLCPYMEEYSEEKEGDLVSSASVGPADISDTWTVSLDIPAIMGNVAQDHIGGIVTEDGIYGCDLSFNVEEQLCQNAVDVVLIMDRSGSMAWDIPSRLSQAKNAANSFLSNLGANDQSALVSYATNATLDKALNSVHLIADGSFSTEAAVNALFATGGTNIGDAIDFGNQELSSLRSSPQAVKVAILLTDGRPTCPHANPSYPGCGYIEDPEDIAYAEDKATEAVALGYKIYTIGLGVDVNETLLQKIATDTGAQYYPAPSGNDLSEIYTQISQEICQ